MKRYWLRGALIALGVYLVIYGVREFILTPRLVEEFAPLAFFELFYFITVLLPSAVLSFDPLENLIGAGNSNSVIGALIYMIIGALLGFIIGRRRGVKPIEQMNSTGIR